MPASMAAANRDRSLRIAIAVMPRSTSRNWVTATSTSVASAGVVADLTQQYGTDSLITQMAGTMFGSTETTFYILAVYFGAVNIKKTRHALPAGLIADITAIFLSVYIVRLLLG